MNIPDPHRPPFTPPRPSPQRQVNGVEAGARPGDEAQREFAEMLLRRLLQNQQPAIGGSPSISFPSLTTQEFARRHAVMTTERGAKRALGLVAYL
ncbi:hypothetical protein [Chromobacterium sp. CV08]|uniref:hypothetical protein n=1 Tax=Chromobacterium sp. CV08 TaxID=3133274 RepID=UPI003DA8B179